ncbi:MAG: hypothetical protein IPO40_01640 [Fibrobacteres bacterium]|nr:hypothetical protein [Fibrobacterota bacterium]
MSRLSGRLLEAGARCVVPCHCSGPYASYQLAGSDGFACEHGVVGKKLSFPV